MMSDEHLHDDEALLRAVARGTRVADARDPLEGRLLAVRNELCRPPAATTRWNHIAAMRRARQDVRRRSTRNVITTVIATVGFVGVSTGLAAAGHLPAPAQAQAARLAEAVGVEIPGHDASAPGDRAPERRGTAPSTEIESRGPVAAQIGPGAGGAPPGRSVPRVTPPGGVDSSPPSGTTPGSSGSAPGQTGANPGHGGTPPGPSGTAPGQVKKSEPTDASTIAPGASGRAPGHDPAGPGNSEHAPRGPRS
jgi:hypothetical protein